MIYCQETGVSVYPIEFNEIDQLRLLRNDESVWITLGNPMMVNEVEQERWYKDQAHDKSKRYFGIHQQDQLIGCVWYNDWDKVNRSARIGIFVDDKFRGMGIGKNVLSKMCDYLQNHLNIHRLWCLVKEDNAPAVALFMKLGFKAEGTQKEAIFRNGKYFNYTMMARII